MLIPTKGGSAKIERRWKNRGVRFCSELVVIIGMDWSLSFAMQAIR